MATEAQTQQVSSLRDVFDASTPLRLLYGGSIVVQLGSQLYPSVTAAVAELISNAWDADATQVWVKVPLDDAWTDDATIEVLDDGIGMNRDDAQFKYLVVGRERRAEEKTDKTKGGRRLHGRKGIGKLAAFGTARTLEVVTKCQGDAPLGFRMNYDVLRELEPAESARVDEFPAEPLFSPEGNELTHGTRVRLSMLQAKRRPSRNRFMTSMRRRFSLDEVQMKVWINGEKLQRFDMPFRYRFPGDAIPPEATEKDAFAYETILDGEGVRREVSWWIGFLDQPVKDEMLQGISVLVNGKMAQRPFKFERTGGAESQLGYEYLVGEVHADWIDDGIGEEDDLISSNRDTLQLEDPKLQPLLQWGQKRLRWALAERGHLSQRDNVERWVREIPDLAAVFDSFNRAEQRSLGRVAERLARLPGLDDTDIVDVMHRVVEVRENRSVANVAQEIRALGDAASEETWLLAADAAEIELRTLRSTVDTRIALLEGLIEILDEDVELPKLGDILVANPWLLGLKFDRAATHLLDGNDSAGEAVVLVDSPVWDPDAASTVVAAYWDERLRPRDDESWHEAVLELEESRRANPWLVARSPVKLDEQLATTWRDCLTRSLRQHEAWRDLMTAQST